MSQLITDCPRCGAQSITFDLTNQVIVGERYSWQLLVETFCICRNCNKPTIFLVAQKETSYESLIREGLQQPQRSVNQFVDVIRPIAIQDQTASEPPEHLPEEIDAIFREGAACMAIGCNNAAGTMFRLCLDMATKSKLPDEAEGLTNRIKRSLGLRLEWLFENKLLPEALEELSSCIRDDGNDGAHQGILSKEDAEDILDFTFILLERLYTEPKRLEIAAQRRERRRENL